MKKINILSTLLAIAAIFTVSCSKEYLEVAPESSVSPSTIFASTNMAKTAVNGLAKMMTTQYLGTQGMNGEGTIINWYNNYMGNDAQKCNLTGWTNTINSNWHESPTSNYDIYPWYYYYKLIGNANAVIEKIEFREDGIIRSRAAEVLQKAADLLKEIERIGLFATLERGVFADIKRPQDGGKGLDGVVRKADLYFNPFIEAMRGKEETV